MEDDCDDEDAELPGMGGGGGEEASWWPGGWLPGWV